MQETTIIGKRINFEASNLKKMKILTMVFENDMFNMNEKKKLDFIVNQAIREYYSSDEIKGLLAL